MQSQKWPAPPSGKSSRLTLVITRYFKFICFAICAKRDGSVGSGGAGLPVATEQNLQRRVQMLPEIKTVAVLLDQHSPRFGQFALLQIVCKPSELNVCSVRRKLSLVGNGLRSQGGNLRCWSTVIGFLSSVICLLSSQDAHRVKSSTYSSPLPLIVPCRFPSGWRSFRYHQGRREQLNRRC